MNTSIRQITKSSILFRRKNYFSEFQLEEMSLANKLYSENKITSAFQYYKRAEQIFQSAHMKDSLLYIQTQKKLIACSYFLGKHEQTIKQSEMKIINQEFFQKNNFFEFSYEVSCFLHGKQSKNSKEKSMKQFVEFLLSKDEKKFPDSLHQEFPVLSRIIESLNSRTDYRSLFVSLIEREKSTETSTKQISSEDPSIQLLEGLQITLKYPNITKENKQNNNKIINEVLKQYQKSNPTQVYVPLINIIMNLIVEKNYMAAEGIVGHIKGQINSNNELKKRQDAIFVNNLYRMLVTRANNSDYQAGWTKEEEINCGTLLSQRIIYNCLDLY